MHRGDCSISKCATSGIADATGDRRSANSKNCEDGEEKGECVGGEGIHTADIGNDAIYANKGHIPIKFRGHLILPELKANIQLFRGQYQQTRILD